MANQWVVKHDGGWAVKAEGSERVTKKFSTQKEAIAYGREIARNQKSELIITGADGKIREKDSHGHESKAKG
ncbi:MAG: DUF2188 domain-containing protein [Actinomycetia bacterium]|nr:DUF2188 domain-containing protein [Actinomycetes bacterium]